MEERIFASIVKFYFVSGFFFGELVSFEFLVCVVVFVWK